MDYLPQLFMSCYLAFITYGVLLEFNDHGLDQHTLLGFAEIALLVTLLYWGGFF